MNCIFLWKRLSEKPWRRVQTLLPSCFLVFDTTALCLLQRMFLCEIARRYPKYLKVYSSFEFVIPLGTRWGDGVNSLREEMATKHEHACCQRGREEARLNEIWHFVMRDEGLLLQTMHSNLHTLCAQCCEYNSRREMKHKMPATNNKNAGPQSLWLFTSWHKQFQCIHHIRRVWEAFIVSASGIFWLSVKFPLILPSALV